MGSAKPWYRESSFFAVLALTFGAYFLRVTQMPVFGEEPRRAVIAREMIETGDWVVPRVQGLTLFSRPPMQNWLIAVASVFTGDVNTWAIRLPSLLATLATVILVFAYSHRFSGTATAFLAGCAYATMYETLEYGRLGETEAVFTACVAGSLLLWDWGYRDGWNRWLLWPLCYGIVAAGMLTKGLQAPLYFGGAVGLQLLATRRWRDLFSGPHLAGLALGIACVAAWEASFIARLDWISGWNMFFIDVAGRFDAHNPAGTVAHLFSFPLEVFAAMLPWSLLLLPAFQAGVRRRLSPHRETIRFLAVAAAWSFFFVWVPSGSRSRYFMPLMPCVAVLIAHIAEAWIQERWDAVRAVSIRRLFAGAAAVFAAFYVGIALPLLAARCDDIARQVTSLKAKLPADARLVSFGPVHHSFLYYYARPVKYEPFPETGAELRDEEYIAVHTYKRDLPPLPFDWELVQDVTCDRYRHSPPQDVMHVVHRIVEPRQASVTNSAASH